VSPIETLNDDLVREFERDARGKRVAAMLAEYAARNDDWRRFALFDPAIYTRNLVRRTEHFEMLVLCWNVGQQSPIHNHAGQNCWMAVLDGEIEEVQYAASASSGAAPLVQGAARHFVPGKVAFINDDIALHRVRPRAGSQGISLHLYSKPIDVCNVYDEQSGQVVSRRLEYHSISGDRGQARQGTLR
jgi:cysteine dioxygenase